MPIYLDNSATTRPDKRVLDFMQEIQANIFGNPSSMHSLGIEAEKLIKKARAEISGIFNHKSDEIIFTSGGTEANNLAILGTLTGKKSKDNHIITTKIEHPSVLNCFKFLENSGFTVTYLPVDSKGMVDLEQLQATVNDKTCLVSVIHVQNEIGTIQPLMKIGSIIKAANPYAVFHVDAVQSFCRLPLDVNKWRADLVSCSAHKIYGPKGVGSLWARNFARLNPILFGGLQEKGIRPGTENTAAIAGFGLAANLASKDMNNKYLALQKKKVLFFDLIAKSGLKVVVNGPAADESAPHILNLAFPSYKAQVLVQLLDQHGIYVSSGSACHSRDPKKSHVLEAIGLSADNLSGSVRFSFSDDISEQEIVKAADTTLTIFAEYSSLSG